MGPLYRDRVRDTTTSTSTGTITLANTAPTGFQTFGAAVADGDTVFYSITHRTANEWETGIGTYTASGTTLARNQVTGSSNGGALVSFSSGTKDVFIGVSAEQFDWTHKIVPPDPTAWSWVNQDGASVATVKGGIVITKTSGSGFTPSYRVKAIPSQPYKIDVLLQLSAVTDTFFAGVCWRNSSSGKLVLGMVQVSAGLHYISIAKFDDATSQNASYRFTTNGAFSPGALVGMRMEDDGTNRVFSILGGASSPGKFYSVGRTDFITPDQVGWYIGPRDGTFTDIVGAVKLVSWDERGQ